MTDREQTRRTVNIICAKRPVRSGPVPAVRAFARFGERHMVKRIWRCSFCGARVKVIA